MNPEFDYQQCDRIKHHRDEDEGCLSPVTFLILVGLLLSIGLVCMYSASYPEAVKFNLPHYYFFLKQAVYAVLGIVAAIILNYMPARLYHYAVIPLLVFSLVSMLLTSFSPFGVKVFGAQRWLDLPLLPSFQPSEVVKFSVILFLSYFLSEKKYSKNKLSYYLIALSVIVVFAFLILIQKAYTTMILFIVISIALLIAGKLSVRYIFTGVAFLFVPAFFLLLSEGYRIRRIVSFFLPNLDPNGLGWQTNMAMNAIKEGGFVGKGLGNGSYKYGLLPEVQNDFIFANIVEELGLFGALFIIILFCLFALIGFRSAERIWNNSPFLSLLATGITTSIIAQVILNIGVVTGLLPPTGIPLAFFSQGGTNLFITLAECGILYKVISCSVVGDRL
ncbi:MAG: putative lipid II flippase FtsW [Sphaerochaetaceae bacterium]|nr:putative lipid II flippase FtsW [Sphaerochaetaceae bacterium]